MAERTALITGGGSGIGKAVARTLADAGYSIALLGRDAAKLEAAGAEIGGEVRAYSCDISDRTAVEATVGRILSDFGAIDVLVCNAGTNLPRRSLEALLPEDWDKLIATNLTGAFNVVHYVLPSMRERGKGQVIQISSISGKRASPLGGVAYSAAKYGQAALGICIGREERHRGIRSSVIYPGEVETPILDARPVKVEAERRAKILQPEDVASAVRFLVELPGRANVPELIITPAVDDWV